MKRIEYIKITLREFAHAYNSYYTLDLEAFEPYETFNDIKRKNKIP